MISELNQYGAASAKIHGMWGKRLKDEDYQQLLAMSSVEEILSFLRGRADWSRALSRLEGQPMTRATLETALRLQYLEDYTKLFAFVGRQDRALMRYPIYKMEMAEILTSLRRIHARNPLQELPAVPEFYQSHSKVDFFSLRQAESLEQIQDCIRGSIFYEPIQHLVRSGQDSRQYAPIEAALQSTYYGKLFKQLRSYKGDTRKLLDKSLTQETDLLNIIHFLRLKRYFSPEDVSMYAFPFSFSHRLSQDFIRELIAAPDYDAAIELLRQSCYGSLFHQDDERIEMYYDDLVYRFNKAQLRRAVPSIYTTVAYLTLKEFELNNLISIIECVRYGVDPRQAAVRLVGVQH
jgi:V/A-type H+-transporting ATPase subunit C